MYHRVEKLSTCIRVMTCDGQRVTDILEVSYVGDSEAILALSTVAGFIADDLGVSQVDRYITTRKRYQ